MVQLHAFLKLEMDEGGQLDDTIVLPLGKEPPPLLKGKVQFTLEQAKKAVKESRGVALLFLLPRR